jgi:hypothetical protein
LKLTQQTYFLRSVVLPNLSISRLKPVVSARLWFLLLLFAVVFLSSFGAQAHEVKPSAPAQAITISIDIGQVDQGDILELASDLADSACNISCCSMSGCGYIQLTFSSVQMIHVFTRSVFNFQNEVWITNPVDSLIRPPRAQA